MIIPPTHVGPSTIFLADNIDILEYNSGTLRLFFQKIFQNSANILPHMNIPSAHATLVVCKHQSTAQLIGERAHLIITIHVLKQRENTLA